MRIRLLAALGALSALAAPAPAAVAAPHRPSNGTFQGGLSRLRVRVVRPARRRQRRR
jgi:hypothetical protein